ncbi:hypothetical protein, partial [Hominenteromicrobium sp.]|uniref:hypothetical protein n=1 Tax=Hominenteromicrobium sp. TaxID=3073581 RepID=UPI003A8C97EA
SYTFVNPYFDFLFGSFHPAIFHRTKAAFHNPALSSFTLLLSIFPMPALLAQLHFPPKRQRRSPPHARPARKFP